MPLEFPKGSITLDFAKAVVGPTETIEMYSNATLVGGATYTPADSGIFSHGRNAAAMRVQYYSTANTAWYSNIVVTSSNSFTAIGDGTNFRILNNLGGNAEYMLFRHYISTGTYERARDEQLAALATWTPAVSGYFAFGGEAVEVQFQMNYATFGWMSIFTASSGYPLTIVLGDGTNLRVKNTHAANAYYHVTMRAKMT